MPHRFFDRIGHTPAQHRKIPGVRQNHPGEYPFLLCRTYLLKQADQP